MHCSKFLIFIKNTFGILIALKSNVALFFQGSCGYEHVFENAYPGRLHSVKEINYFLENIDNLNNYLSYQTYSNPVLKTFMNLTLGNVFNSYLKNKTFLFPNNLEKFLKSNFYILKLAV